MRDLAAQVNIHRVVLSQIESGRVNPTAAELDALARALDVPSERLLDHIDESAFLPPGAEARAAAREV